ncbi:calcium-binding protein [Mangrovicoccus ximenensis]|uniref:calcium-binding protein n=1 Tax=Mangrovicoccus ximenensis TaxID=1911570 RepID=UPI000D34FF57|nr:hypothetical protein [Mangrovicoccus ximenensis]
MRSGTGNDRIAGEAGHDRIGGDAGDDTLSGGPGNDTLAGGSPDAASAGNDVFAGGKGDDLLQGGAENDIYLFGAGDGIDTLTDEGGTDRIVFGEDVAPGDVRVLQGADGLELRVAGGTRIVVPEGTAIETVGFADGTEWSWAELLRRSMLPGAGDDAIALGDRVRIGGEELRITGCGPHVQVPRRFVILATRTEQDA